MIRRVTRPRLLLAVFAALLACPPPHTYAQERSPQYHGTIILSINGDMTRIAGYTSLVEAYRRVQPGVEVMIELKGGAFGGMGGYPTWLNTQLASGEPRPDIVSGNYSPTYDRYVNFDYYRHIINPHTGNPWGEDIEFDFSIYRNSVGERILLSTQAVHIQWFYNVDLFEELGIEVPETFEAFLDVCEQLQAAGQIPTTLRFDLRYHQWLFAILWDQYSRPHFRHIRALPGDWNHMPETDGNWVYDPEDPKNDALVTPNQMRYFKALVDGTIDYESAEFIQCLENMKAVARFGPSDFLVEQAGAGNDPYSLFLSQRAAMHLDGSWLLPQIDLDMTEMAEKGGSSDSGRGLRPFRWGAFDPPPQSNPLVVAPVRSVESSAGEYVSVVDKNQPQTDLVMDFVMFWLSKPGYQAFLDGQVAANEFFPTGKIMVNGVRVPDHYQRLIDSINTTGNCEIITNSLIAIPPAGSSLIQDARQVLVDLIQDKVSTADAARRISGITKDAVYETLERNGLPRAILDNPGADPRDFR